MHVKEGLAVVVVDVHVMDGLTVVLVDAHVMDGWLMRMSWMMITMAADSHAHDVECLFRR